MVRYLRMDVSTTNATHRVSLHVAKRHLVGFVQAVPTVHLALEARLLPRRVVQAVVRGHHPGHRGHALGEDERLEDRPAQREDPTQGVEGEKGRGRGTDTRETQFCLRGGRFAKRRCREIKGREYLSLNLKDFQITSGEVHMFLTNP